MRNKKQIIFLITMKKAKKVSQESKVSKYQSVTDKIIALIEKGTLPWRKDWNCGGNNSFQNPISDSVYQGINPILCKVDCLTYDYQSVYFASFNQARELGWQVIKGSKATSITWAAPFIKEKTTESGEVETERGYGVRWFNVFNFDCFDDSNSETKKTDIINKKNQNLIVNSDNRDEKIESFINSQNAVIRVKGHQPCYVPSKDEILMPDFSDFSSSNAYYSTLLHELAHWTGHHTRLDRVKGSAKDSSEYAFEELIAELSSAYSGNYLGLSESLLENHSSYLSSWLELLKSDEKAFFKAARLGQKATDYLIKQATLTDVESDELTLDRQLSLF
jgi:antirestriction protein ArdC